MRTVVAGSRGATLADMERAWQECPWSSEITVVLSGTARGADKHGEELARRHGLPVELYPADWEGLGRRAGMVRNSRMANRAHALLAVWDGSSRGADGMIKRARVRNLRVFVWRVDQE